MSTNMDHYTKHGLHMTTSGKEWLSRRIADCINKLLEDLKAAPTVVEWKESLIEGSQPEAIGHKDNNLKTGQQEVRTSSRIWTHPRKMDTFLWSTR